ncbi:hypothetical protein EIP91_004993 [Steccherinum ochraceum]|uniref:Uncharacterized protein n=1 Tax=Steccherinum ochraceum TaxID=92696 RepID=A0A4R0R8E6_9APHY|nr:hypothetical protein EIP91_004993 [Steccherinum ochraceum]
MDSGSRIPQGTEIVADSEDEMVLDLPLKRAGNGNGPAPGDVSLIQTASFTAQQHSSHMTSNISYFTEQSKNLSQPPIAILPSAAEPITGFTGEAPAAPKPRPKPRPKKKPPPEAGQSTASSSSPTGQDTSVSTNTPNTSIDGPSSNVVKPRPKPRPKKPVQTGAGALGVVGLTADPIATASSRIQGDSTIIDDFTDHSMDIAERAKFRSRAARGKQPIVDVIEITDDEDELLLVPPKRSKAKEKSGKQPAKRPKIVHPEDLAGQESTQASLPIPTSDFSLHLSQGQLPPSDPPLPSTATLPPISTPPDMQQPHMREASPHGSPILNPARKRKRVIQTIGSDDEDVAQIPSSGTGAADTSMMLPPPPPFFASSSSAASTSGAGQPPLGPADASTTSSSAAPSAPAAKKRATKKQKGGEVGDKPSNADEDQSKPKAKGRRKKDDDDDEEFGSKPKAKPRRKPAAKSKKPESQVEVVVDMPPPRSRTRTKSNDVVPETQPGALTTPCPEGPSTGSASDGPNGAGRRKSPPVSAGPSSGGQSESAAPQKSGDQGKKDTSPASVTSGKPSDGKNSTGTLSSKSKGKRRAIESSDDEDEVVVQQPKSAKAKSTSQKDGPSKEQSNSQSSAGTALGRSGSFKENGEREVPQPPTSPQVARTPAPKSFSRGNSIVPKQSLTPMSELIRKVNSLPGSPFVAARPTHSPFLKSSKTMLRKIAPLHPNRRTPPPPPPRPPPPKKTKKQLAQEEKWEEELEESIDGWYCLPEEERAALRRAKRDAELGFDD